MRKIENYTGKKVSGLWRTEWLPRLTGKHVGIPMPHFHLILFTVRFIPYAVVNKFWRDSLGGVLICRTDIRRLANEKQHGYYVAKYAAKVPDKVLLSVSHIAAIDGQHWGYLRAKNLPRATQEYFLEVPWETAAKLREIAAENLPWYDKETDKGFCLLTRFGRELARKFLQTLLDSEAVSR
jgi:hypothetical protein